jgi:hypothetical protein
MVGALYEQALVVLGRVQLPRYVMEAHAVEENVVDTVRRRYDAAVSDRRRRDAGVVAANIAAEERDVIRGPDVEVGSGDLVVAEDQV